MSLLRRFPAVDIAKPLENASSTLFEERSTLEWKEEERQRFVRTASVVVCNPSKARVLLLDGHDLLASKALVAAGFQWENIHVPNWHAGTIASKHARSQRPNLYGCSLHDFLHAAVTTMAFDVVWFDTCAQCSNSQLEDIKFSFEHLLFNMSHATLFYATYCGKRERDVGNFKILEYADKGISRDRALFLLCSEYAMDSKKYAIQTRTSMCMDTNNHGMFTVGFVIQPCITSLDIGDKLDTVQKTKIPKTVGKEVNFTNWKQYAMAHTSKLPVTIIKRQGSQFICKARFTKIPCVTERHVKTCDSTFETFRVPSGRVIDESSSKPCFSIGSIVEVAWRETQFDPISWWTATVLKVSGQRVSVRYEFQPRTVWVEKTCCRAFINHG